MRSKKSESSLSARFGDGARPGPRRASLRGPLAALVAALAFALAGCGASGPTRPDGEGADVADVAGASHVTDATDVTNATDAAAGDSASDDDVPEAARQSHGAAVAAMRRGDYTEAELELEHLMLAHPELPGPHVNAAILYMRDGRDDEAHAVLEQALAIDPGHAEGNNQLGILLRKRGEFEAAERAYRRAIASRPDYALAMYNLGVLLDLYLHRKSEALDYYERYQSVLAQPDETVARWIIDLRRRVGADDGAARVAQGELQ